jgi:predicted transcriptional regulator
MAKKKQEGIFGSIRINKQKYIDEFIKLYKEGLNDSEIARCLGINNVTVSTWRNDRNLPKNFQYKRKFDTNQFMELYNKHLSYAEIAKQLNVSSSAIQEYASSIGLKAHDKNPDLEMTEEEFQVFLGTLYGDGHLTIPSDSKNARGHFAHSLKQQEYCFWKYDKLKRFCSKPRFEQEYDKRTEKIYYSVRVLLRSYPCFTRLYPLLYNNKIKYISKQLINKLEPLGIAVWFMDDGYISGDAYHLSTNCFTDEDLDLIIEMFKNKFDIEFTKFANHVIRVRWKDCEKFRNLISPYIHSNCLYKLGPTINSVKQGNSLEDNPVLNPQEIEENAERLEVMPNEKDEAIKSSTKAGHCSK